MIIILIIIIIKVIKITFNIHHCSLGNRMHERIIVYVILEFMMFFSLEVIWIHHIIQFLTEIITAWHMQHCCVNRWGVNGNGEHCCLQLSAFLFLHMFYILLLWYAGFSGIPFHSNMRNMLVYQYTSLRACLSLIALSHTDHSGSHQAV